MYSTTTPETGGFSAFACGSVVKARNYWKSVGGNDAAPAKFVPLECAFSFFPRHCGCNGDTRLLVQT